MSKAKQSQAAYENPAIAMKNAQRLRARALSGEPITDEFGLIFPPHPVGDGWQWVEVTGFQRLQELMLFWACPVTIAPPGDGVEYWSLELEDGKHAHASLLDPEAA